MGASSRILLLSSICAIMVLSAGCIRESEEGTTLGGDELEVGKAILVREDVSGFSQARYHNFVVLFDTGHLYKINVTNYGSEEEIENQLSMSLIKHIMNITPSPMNWPLISLLDDTGSSQSYTVKISKSCEIPDDSYNDLLDMIDILRTSDLEEVYHGAGLSCMGWVYFTFTNGMSNKTVSCYYDTSRAPVVIQDLDVYLDELCDREF